MLTMDTKSKISMANSIADQCFTAKTENANGDDWQEEIYQKIKSMKEMYLSELQRHDFVPQSPQNEQIDKLRMFKLTLERIVYFLHLNKHDIQPSHKEKLLSVDRLICFFLHSVRPHKPAVSPLQQQLPQPPVYISQPTLIQPLRQQGMVQLSAVQSPSLSNLLQNQLSTQSAHLAHVEERLGMVEFRLEKVEARSEKVEALLVDINKTLNDLVKIQGVKSSNSSSTRNSRPKRKHRVAEMIRKSCKHRRVGREAVKIVSPVALHDDCANGVQKN